MSLSDDIQLAVVIAVAVVVAIAIVWGMGYTKAVNDQEFYKIVGSEMSEEDFAQWMTKPAAHSGGGA
jgi:hypothetical protein